MNDTMSRRVVIKSSIFGILMASVPNILYSKSSREEKIMGDDQSKVNPRKYPSVEDDIANEIVGVSHFNLDRLKELVNPRPELARATWDWGFGDWETAIGAASHVARRDIVEYLISKGARPDIFTFAMLGSFSGVKAMIDSVPGARLIAGPHGISLIQHVKNGMADKTVTGPDAGRLLEYLESFSDTGGPNYMIVEENDKSKFLGDYRYGEGEGEGLTVKTNMRKLLTLGKLGKNGGAIYKIGENRFTYNGAPSVTIDFLVENGKVLALTINEPGLILKAVRV